jgi:glycosyltransferase involved in cell wall biosynthesis
MMIQNKYLPKIRNHFEEKQYQEAKLLLEKAVVLLPTFYVYYELIGDVCVNTSDHQQAYISYSQALKLNPRASWISRKIKKLPSHVKPKFCGIYDRYPDLTGKRKAEGGKRVKGIVRSSTPDLPLVTIVTAVYDNHTTFQRCIDSVVAQTYKNVEYIVIDGGSPQPTIDLILRNQDNVDYFISEPDTGIYSAMNKGIRLARGEYVCLLNSDDLYEPDFVSETVKVAIDTGTDVVYTDYYNGETKVVAQKMGPGVLLGQMYIRHNTFLTSRATYDLIGPYREDFHIVSDSIWIGDAFLKGIQFHHLEKALFTFSYGGLSSGNSEDRRKLIIQEGVKRYRMYFPQLTEAEANEVFLFNFDRKRTAAVADIAKRHVGASRLMAAAFKGFIEYCFGARNNFYLEPSDADDTFVEMVRLAETVGVDLKNIRIETKHGTFSDVLKNIDRLVSMRKTDSRKKILHFVTVFSASPETFIYDLITRLEHLRSYDNFVLFEYARLRDERPYAKAIQVCWNDFKKPVARQIYKYIVDRLKPDVVIAHFALNEWKWAQRIKDLDISIPTISMCHGIDVFALRENADYRNYIINDFSAREGTVFTAVSEYLRKEMIANGIPEDRIHLLPNTVNDRFFLHRKTDDFYDRNRTLRLLSIGRLIQWKGHRYLIEALSKFGDQCTKDFHLTIVFGNGADELKNLQRLVAKENLQDNVSFEPFVDFNEHPDYISKFDCFIHPSTCSDDSLQRSETFGLAVLEAIVAGLPVITTNAGGLPEVIGKEGRYAKIVPHGDSEAIATALATFWREGDAFSDNRTYAEGRLAKFSAQKQLQGIQDIIEKLTEKKIRAALFSSTTIDGAGYAAYRLHRGLGSTKVTPHMFTRGQDHKGEPRLTVINHHTGNIRNWYKSQIKPNVGITINTINHRHISSAKLLRMVEPFDIINLHWHARFLSIENIASLTHSGKPVVMTIRDMMPVTGGCHCFHGCSKWLYDCADCPQMPSSYKHYPAAVLAAKRHYYNFHNITLIAPSNHTRNILERAPYFKDCRIETIPNSIETDIFRPYDKIEARKEFSLPQNKKIIGYIPSFSSEIKGYSEFLNALKNLDSNMMGDKPFVMLMGNETPANDMICLEKKYLGYIKDNECLARAYSAADVIVVPSLEETFSNTTAEAISCGVPVVGFKTGAIPDLAINAKTGYTVEIGDVDGLAKGIINVLNGPDLSKACREHAEKVLAFMNQAKRYEALFNELVDGARKSSNYHVAPKIFEYIVDMPTAIQR